MKGRITLMNRKQSRGLKARERYLKLNHGDIDSPFDIQVEGKFGQIVMICANAKGRKIVEDLWPDVQWTRDEIFSRAHSAEWLFTHVQVTRLPPHFETPPSFDSPDALGFAVACAVHRRAWPIRVAYYTGQGADLQLNAFGSPPHEAKGVDVALYAEYVPPTGDTLLPVEQRGTVN
jgi:hypothetical protein